MTDQHAFVAELDAVIAELAATPTAPKPSRPAPLLNLPPDPERMNDYRAQLAGGALFHYQDATEADREDALGDLLCNLMHLCDRDAELGGFDAQLERAKRGYRMETTPDAD